MASATTVDNAVAVSVMADSYIASTIWLSAIVA